MGIIRGTWLDVTRSGHIHSMLGHVTSQPICFSVLAMLIGNTDNVLITSTVGPCGVKANVFVCSAQTTAAAFSVSIALVVNPFLHSGVSNIT